MPVREKAEVDNAHAAEMRHEQAVHLRVVTTTNAKCARPPLPTFGRSFAWSFI